MVDVQHFDPVSFTDVWESGQFIVASVDVPDFGIIHKLQRIQFIAIEVDTFQCRHQIPAKCRYLVVHEVEIFKTPKIHIDKRSQGIMRYIQMFQLL